MENQGLNHQGVLQFILEAQDSFKILLKYLGQADTKANILLLKWPDVFSAYFQNDIPRFTKDINQLICLPIKVLAESLIVYVEKEAKAQKRIVDSKEKMLITQRFYEQNDKKGLIAVCNGQIEQLKLFNINLESIKEGTCSKSS